MKQIELTSGYFAFVDDSDFEFLNQWKWRANKQSNGDIYAETDKYIDGKRFIIKMHRLIIGVTDGNVLVDHRDGNGLNNQRNNLRPCNKSQNGMNRGTIRKNRLTKFKGVQMRSDGKKWVAEIVANKKKTHLGSFNTDVEAAIAYNNAAKIHHGEFARLNVIK